MRRINSIVIILLLATTSISCGPNRRRSNTDSPPDPYADILTIDSRSMTVRYFLGTANNEDKDPTLPDKIPVEHRDLMKQAIVIQLDAFEAEIGHISVLPVTHIWIESSWAPCGIPNGGACYTAMLVWAIGGEALNYPFCVPHYYHELFHHYLWLTTGDLDAKHAHPGWGNVYVRQWQLNDYVYSINVAQLSSALQLSGPLTSPDTDIECGCQGK